MTYIKYLLGRINFHLTNHFKPLTVHTETVFIDEVWREVKKKVLSKKIKTWYVMTPSNYEYYKAYFNTKLTKKQISEKLKERYLWMIKKGEHIELHIHLSKLMKITYKEQEELFRESLLWLKKELNFKPTEFVPGWWAYNKDTKALLKKYNLKLIPQNKYKATHDYNWAYNLSGMAPIK